MSDALSKLFCVLLECGKDPYLFDCIYSSSTELLSEEAMERMMSSAIAGAKQAA